MSECNHDCSSCGENCSSRVREPLKVTDDTKINKIIGILSGKGGVGKSMVSSLLAIELARKGYRVGLLDGDITGPSIPKMFGIKGYMYGDEQGVYPATTNLGIKAVSVNMMLENEDDPVLWRGPILGGILKQFYNEVHWGELDYLLIDLPPGTGDIAISLIQDIPVDSFVMVTTPSKLVSMVVGKTINMAKQCEKPIVGLIDNMAYVKCDNCGHNINIYKEDYSEEASKKYGLELLAKLPIDVNLANDADNGEIENYCENYLEKVVEAL